MEHSSNIQLPPGFRFHPSDEELIVHYLRNKAASRPIPASIVAEVDLYKYNPWELPKKALFGDDEWYFFSPRDRKYPNGARPNRAAASGYWKATGTDKPILTSCGSHSLGVKKALVFYKGRPPKGTKTNWIMHEYRLPCTTIKPSRSKTSMRLDDWVLCRVRQKDNVPRNMWEEQTNPANQPMTLFSPKNEQQPSKNSDPTYDIVANYLNNDCPMMAYILASQNNIPIQTSSNVSFQVSTSPNNNTSGSIYEEVSDMRSSLVTAASPDSLMNPLKRNSFDDSPDYHENIHQTQTNKKNRYQSVVVPSTKKIVTNKNTDFSFCGQYLPQQNLFNHYAANFSMDFQDLLQ